MSFLFTQRLFENAVGSAASEIRQILKDTRKQGIHIVADVPGLGDRIRFGMDLGADQSTWGNDYVDIANRKADLCLRTRLSTDTVVYKIPLLLEEGDPLFAGGIFMDGVVVAVSGLDQYDDKKVAVLIYNALIALCKEVTESVEGESRVRLGQAT